MEEKNKLKWDLKTLAFLPEQLGIEEAIQVTFVSLGFFF